MKCLIVEGNVATRSAMYEHLREFTQSNIAANGKEALEMVWNALTNDEPYDLIFFDVNLSELDGRNILAEIRRLESDSELNTRGHALVALTSEVNVTTEQYRTFRSLADGYLVKPIAKEKLTQHVAVSQIAG